MSQPELLEKVLSSLNPEAEGLDPDAERMYYDLAFAHGVADGELPKKASEALRTLELHAAKAQVKERFVWNVKGTVFANISPENEFEKQSQLELLVIAADIQRRIGFLIDSPVV